MLELKNISKRYITGDLTQQALDGVDLSFRESEFVAILGPSGSGKTTLLNIIGGLDRYDSGDIVINSVSTKEYNDHDWDAYRNHTIGFVFQSYNLIPHQSVLANVELALTISGVGKKERRRRAKDALSAVGLADQMHKRPSQMSGGQMQRVAIARALVNDPDVLLADEPTGALDSETSIQVMRLLQQVANDRLVIMVTHNSELADEYATRIVRLKDGAVISDTDPFNESSAKQVQRAGDKKGRVSMSFLTALSLSLNNLRTKKGRTLLTAFAGSIGIIGIAMILALSTGIHNYVSDIQRSTLASYPVVLEKKPNDFLKTFAEMRQNDNELEIDENTVYSDPRIYKMFNAAFSGKDEENNISSFNDYFVKKLNDADSGLNDIVSAVQYTYAPAFDAFFIGSDGKYHNTDISKSLFNSTAGSDDTSMNMFNMVSSRMSSSNLFTELVPGKNGEVISELIRNQFELVYGAYPETANEIVLVLNENNAISDNAFYALGYIEESELKSMLNSMFKGEALDEAQRSAAFSELIGKQFKVLHKSEAYRSSNQGQWEYIGDDDAAMEMIVKNGLDLTITGIIKPASGKSMQIQGAFGYTSLLTDIMLDMASSSELIKAQRLDKNKNIDLLSGLPFVVSEEDELSVREKAMQFKDYAANLDSAKKVELYTDIIAMPDDETLFTSVEAYLSQFSTRDELIELASSSLGFSIDEMKQYLSEYSDVELKEMLAEQTKKAIEEKSKEDAKLQVAALIKSSSAPADIFGASGYKAVADLLDKLIEDERDEAKLAKYYDSFMPASVSGSTLKDRLSEFGAIDRSDPDTISIYVSSFDDKETITRSITEYNNTVDSEEDKIEYTDYVALLMSGVTTIINAVSYGLIAFVAISLIVSSIMIGIITYISVLERTKEIGVLRSIGASKRDISSVFNAETLIVGFFAGLIGIGVTVLLCIPLNMILQKITGIDNLKAVLPFKAAVALVIISMTLTLISGLIPAGIAARKDPVAALRSE